MLDDWIFGLYNDIFNYEIQDDPFAQLPNDLMSFNDISQQDFFQNNNDLLNNSNKTTSYMNDSKNVEKVILDENDISFKKSYYSVCTKKKRLNKIFVKEIHNRFLVPILGFPPMTRSEYRCIAKYFRNYSNKNDQIIKCLEENKANIQQMIQLASCK